MQVKKSDRPDLHAETRTLEGLTALVSIAAKHWRTTRRMRVKVSRAYFHAKTQRPVLVRLQVDHQRKSAPQVNRKHQGSRQLYQLVP